MSFYNTGNPVPSIDPRDLDDNAKHIDEIVNSTELTVIDRLGTTRKTIAGLEIDANEAVSQEFVTNLTNSIPNDGVTPASAALNAAALEAYNTGKILVLSGNYFLDADVEIRRQFITNGNVAFTAAYPGDVAPVRKINFTRRFDVDGMTFNNILAVVAPLPGDTTSYAPVSISRNNLNGSQLVIGSNDSIVSGFSVSENKVTSAKTKSYTAIKVINACSIDIHNNEMQEFACGIEVAPTKSYAASQVRIYENLISSCDAAIRLTGTSKCRISSPTVERNTMAGSQRGAASAALSAFYGYFCTNLLFANNSVSSKNDCIKLQGCLGSRVKENEFIQTGTAPIFRFTSCRDTYFRKNKLQNSLTSAFIGFVGSIELNPVAAGLYYKSANFVMEDNEVFGGAFTVKFQNTTGIRHNRNVYELTQAIPANSIVWFSVNCLNNKSYDNIYRAPSGTPVKLDGGIILDTSVSAQTLVATTAPATSVTAPVITATDAALNNSKSYVVAFTVGSIKNIKGLENSSSKQTLSAWMATVPGAILGWNSSSWNVADGRLPDVVVDGGLHEQFGNENYYFAQGGMVLDYGNILTCRDFFRSSVDLNFPLLVGAKAIEEQSWQTAAMSPPLVVDGAVYDPVASGIVSSQAQWDTVLAARMCIGQKADLSFVVVAVDGGSPSTGCTLLQLANKMLAIGCVNACNLDGGGSATLWYSGAVINVPTDPGGERPIPAVLYV